ncbi:2033_t:CDS:2 [Diversispora eburnea]|uniref:2033_t:CDS:1 n=1 Tax=Diversispora eburnea TaxID=1213867 RepID=A0A9N9EZD7_9GLOM|nr:2033_t:CDS:2 [Diversispora eburnea]
MCSYVLIQDKTNNIEVVSSLKNLLNNPTEIPFLTLENKIELVSTLISDLDENGVQKSWSQEVKLLALQTLKTLGRDAKGCDLLFSREGFRVLSFHAEIIPTKNKLEDTPVFQEALTCIANALLLKENTRSIFEEYDGVASICRNLKDKELSIKTQFLILRILFLMSVNYSPVIPKLIDDLGISNILYKSLRTHVKELSNPEPVIPSSPSITRVMVLNEQLKFLFNITMKRDGKDRKDAINFKFEKLLQPIIDIILNIQPPSPLPLSPPHSHAIHALLNFPVTPYKSIWFPPKKKSQQYELFHRLIEMLKSMVFIAVQDDPDSSSVENNSKYGVDFDEVITPLVALLRKLAEDDELAKTIGRNQLLPDDVDRSKPLEKGDSISANLIRIMTSVMLPHLRDSVSELLFVLCDQDANLFIHHVGYGNGAGFLMSRNIMIQPSIHNDHSEKPINPITGQYVENESPSLTNMTDEEKEREAEKLFVLFERLKKTGVMDVKNPIEESIKSGKFFEMENDDKDQESD